MNEPSTRIVNGRIVLGDGIRTGHLLTIRRGLIESITSEMEPHDGDADTVDAEGGFVIPGLVDIHLHGAYGRTFNEGSPDAWRSVLDAHCEMGTTTATATIATASIEDLVLALSAGQGLLAEATPGLAGIHLEGPYLSPSHRGAHGLDWLREPLDGSWQDLAPFVPCLRIVTLAPELAGSETLINALHAAGVVVSAGHSGADPDTVRRARAEGLSHFAHLWSGQSVLTRRGPWRDIGLLEAALSSDKLTAEIIADGLHAPAELTRIAYRCLGPDRLCLVSDASAGTGLPVGCHFRMGSAAGIVDRGVALSLDGATFCGSTSFLVDILRFSVREAGIPIVESVQMASTTPARILGLADRVGRLAPGLAADLVVLDQDFDIRAVMRGGRWVKTA